MLNRQVVEVLGAESSLVRLGREAVQLEAGELRRLLDAGELVRREDGQLQVFRRQGDAWQRALFALGRDGALRLTVLDIVDDATHAEEAVGRSAEVRKPY